jgi:hypothetical protein
MDNTPVGLKNVGNSKNLGCLTLLACYFNSIIQSYFFIPGFTEKILQAYKADEVLNQELKQINQSSSDEVVKKRQKYSK